MVYCSKKGVISLKVPIQESTENYLETILVLSKQGSQVRSVDIANELDFTRPSVSVAMKKLRERGYIEVSPDGYITLTPPGLEIAESMYDRHMVISNWLISLGVETEIALDDACRMEHVISEHSFLAIKKHVENLD